MSEYLVKRQSLENIADEIRVLSGTTESLGLTEMATNVNDANDEVADQTDLIAQVASALQGKSVPGGGERVYIAKETINREALPINTLGDFEITNLTPRNCEIYVSYILPDNSGIFCVANVFDALEEVLDEGVVVNRENYVITNEEGMFQLGVAYGDEVLPLLAYAAEDIDGISKGAYAMPIFFFGTTLLTVNAVVLTA